MRDIVLLGFTGLLLGLLVGTTLVVVREGESHSARIVRGESAAGASIDSIPATADSASAGLEEAVLPVAGDSSRVAAVPLPIDSAAPTLDEGRGTPQQADSADMAAAMPAAPQVRPAVGPLPGPDDLAKYFAAMQPRDAARVLEQMSDAEIARILAMVGGRRASAIMGSLAPERAAAIGRLALGSPQQEVS